MISMKSPREIEAMRKAGRLTAQARSGRIYGGPWGHHP